MGNDWPETMGGALEGGSGNQKFGYGHITWMMNTRYLNGDCIYGIKSRNVQRAGEATVREKQMHGIGGPYSQRDHPLSRDPLRPSLPRCGE